MPIPSRTYLARRHLQAPISTVHPARRFHALVARGLHDVKAPLRALIGYLDHLKGADGRLDAAILERVREQGERLEVLLRRAGALALAMASPAVVASVPLQELLAPLQERTASLWFPRKLRLRLEGDAVLRVDRERLLASLSEQLQSVLDRFAFDPGVLTLSAQADVHSMQFAWTSPVARDAAALVQPEIDGVVRALHEELLRSMGGAQWRIGSAPSVLGTLSLPNAI